jgi:hypothetical protein
MSLALEHSSYRVYAEWRTISEAPMYPAMDRYAVSRLFCFLGAAHKGFFH